MPPEPLKPEIVPPVVVTSAWEKSTVESLRVKVIVAVSPLLRADLLLLIAIVGASVSIVIGVVSEPAVLPLPAASVNAFEATEIVPDTVELTVGVKVAT